MRTRRILIVEDDHDLRQMYRTTLMLEGFDVTETADGLDALRQLDASPPDLVLLDLGLPIISGQTVAEEISAQADLRHIPVLIVTGSPEQAENLDAACVMGKPVTSQQLLEAVRRCLATVAPPDTA